MKPEKIGLWVGIAAGVVAIWYYLRGTPTTNLVTYPNTQASGQPAIENPASVYNIAAPSPMPSPNLIYGPPPAMPSTPAYQNYNYSPVNILGLTPQGAAIVPTPSKPLIPSGGACCTDTCGCASCSGGGTYQDGNKNSCLVANPAEQVRAGSGAMYRGLAANIDSSAVAPDAGGTISGQSSSPVVDATIVPHQVQGLAQGQVKTPISASPGMFAPVLTWQQIGVLIGVNSGGA